MKYLYLINLFLLGSLFVGAQERAIIDKEVSEIYKNYSNKVENLQKKSFSEIDAQYKKTKSEKKLEELDEKYIKIREVFLVDQEKFQQEKLLKLRNLVDEVKKRYPLIGKVASAKNENEKTENYPPPPTSGQKIIQNGVKGHLIKSPSYDLNKSDELKLEEKDKIRKNFSENFRIDYINTNDDILKTRLLINVDSDGSLKDITAEGVNEEVNLLSILTIYSLNIKLEPYENGGYFLVRKFTLPISLNFE
ncbi:hypothetical protein GCM10010992_18360 [Cloacibacterium rupense]|uniref:TonB C-terminal domain-containing protein n=1 Tax=Cloacibacterium rupense TaxID=517423 RepID=A0ABQ2NK09_9FLAO|nr:hypothetical protein [Cloacibacterium rupense]GGP04734.1 hypothetical protein GCM10010992_18360 [Cloacibacterium rupense]